MRKIKQGEKNKSKHVPQSFIDIKEFKNLQEIYSSTAKKLTIHQKIKSFFSLKLTLQQAITNTLNLIKDNFNFEAGSILLIDENKNELYFASAFGEKAQEILKFRIPINSNSIAGHTVRDKIISVVSDVAKDLRYDKTISLATGFNIKSILALPILSGIECFGVVELINKIGSDIFTNEEVNTLKEITDSIGIIINNHYLLNKK